MGSGGPGPGPLSLSIAPEIQARHPDVMVGGFVVAGLRAAVDGLGLDAGDSVAQVLADQGARIEALAAHPLIADWRAAIAGCGLKPSTWKSSPEQLARRALKSGPVRTGLRAVDLYCEVATRHLAPMGGYDLARLPGTDIELRLARPGTDRFEPLGGEREMALGDAVAVYAVGDTVICWAYNCRDSADTCLTAETDRAVFVGEAVTPRQHGPIRAALAELAHRLAEVGAQVGPAGFARTGNESRAELVSSDLS